MAPTFDVSSFFDQEAYSDIIIKYGTKQLKAHKMIICSKSDYFKKLCGPDSRFAESKKNIIELKDDDENAVTSMFKWLYSFEYDEAWTKPSVAPLQRSSFERHVAVYIVADKYQLPALSELAKQRIESILESCSDASLVVITDANWREKNDRYPTFVTELLKEERSKRLARLLHPTSFLALLQRHPELAMEVVCLLRPGQTAKEMDVAKCSKKGCAIVFVGEKGTVTKRFCPYCTRNVDTTEITTRWWL
ncbi:hypothetical protein LTR85_009218 [Meristemomyces frigidus]|nr:hypothetical protein LTR85_009218 [Meristemomyces frigidus]